MLFRLFSLAIMFSAATAQGIVPNDLYKLRSVGDVALAPDGSMVAYTISHNDGVGRPYSQLHVLNLKTNATSDFSRGSEKSSNPVWSPR